MVYCPTWLGCEGFGRLGCSAEKSPLVVTSLVSLCLKCIFSVCSVRGLGALWSTLDSALIRRVQTVPAALESRIKLKLTTQSRKHITPTATDMHKLLQYRLEKKPCSAPSGLIKNMHTTPNLHWMTTSTSACSLLNTQLTCNGLLKRQIFTFHVFLFPWAPGCSFYNIFNFCFFHDWLRVKWDLSGTRPSLVNWVPT